MPKALVTGATGFIGRVLCKSLMEKGWLVRGTARNPAGAVPMPEGIEIEQIEGIGPNTDWSKALKDADTVVHLAARVHVPREGPGNSLAAFRLINTMGTDRLARAAAASGVKRFVFVSTVKVNGEGRETPYTEKDEPGPEDPYGISKWEAEQALQEIADTTPLEVVILRPPLVYGPQVKANFLSLLKWVRRGVPLPLGGVKNRRSLIFVGNLVEAILTCMTQPGAANQTYLVKDGEDVSTPELIRRVAKALEVRARLFPVPPALLRMAGGLAGKSAAVERVAGSLTVGDSKICRELGWKPGYTMDQGLRETAGWFLGQGSHTK